MGVKCTRFRKEGILDLKLWFFLRVEEPRCFLEGDKPVGQRVKEGLVTAVPETKSQVLEVLGGLWKRGAERMGNPGEEPGRS